MEKNCKGRVSLLYKKLRDVLFLEFCISPRQIHLGRLFRFFPPGLPHPSPCAEQFSRDLCSRLPLNCL